MLKVIMPTADCLKQFSQTINDGPGTGAKMHDHIYGCMMHMVSS